MALLRAPLAWEARRFSGLGGSPGPFPRKQYFSDEKSSVADTAKFRNK